MITIGIPVYNVANNVERCIRSAMKSATDGCHLLVIDNCSTDNTAEIARGLLKDVPGARVVVNEKNIGRTANWNRCLELCETKYLRFAMANDVLFEGSSNALERWAERHVNVSQVFSPGRLAETFSPAASRTNPEGVTTYSTGDETLAQFCNRGIKVRTSLDGILINRSIAAEHGVWFDPSIPYLADYKFNIQMAALGGSVFTDEPTYFLDLSVKDRGYHYKSGGKEYLRENRIAADALRHAIKKRDLPGCRHPYLYICDLSGQLSEMGGVTAWDALFQLRAHPLHALRLARRLTRLSGKAKASIKHA